MTIGRNEYDVSLKEAATVGEESINNTISQSDSADSKPRRKFIVIGFFLRIEHEDSGM